MDDVSEITAHIARTTASLRKRKGWTAAELGEQMTRQGIRWDRFTVSNLENGRRQNVTVTELLALALVLDVAPVHLLVPLTEGNAAVTPVESYPAARVRAWIRGERPLPKTDERFFRTEVPLRELGSHG